MDVNFASIIIDIILTIVTGFMAIATYKMVQSTNESVEEMKQTRVEANSAEVIMYFNVKNNRMYLILENIGNTVAKDISIDVEPKLKDTHNKDYEHLKEISFLPPNYQIKAFFDMGFNYLKKEDNPVKYKFIITFTNIYNDKIKREYISDLSYIRSVSYLTSESDSVEMSLTKIKEELQNTNNYLKKLSMERKYE